MKIDTLLEDLVHKGGSDLHVKAGRPPLMRINGDLRPTSYPVLTKEGTEEILNAIMSEMHRRKLEAEREIDFSYLIKNLARFRVSVFYQSNFLGAVFRAIPIKIQTVDELGLPPVLKEIISRDQGLILVTGPTGSGKSTSLAAMIEFLNERIDKHILTIEDPIEFVHTDKRCTINQREVGTDTRSFFNALKRGLRQDPDIILVGEMRDPETIHTALTASETGHLVVSTLHTTYAKQSITRIIDAFPPEQQHHIRIRTAMSLVATVAQRLVKRSDDQGRIAVMEIMINTPTIKKLIAEGKVDQIDKVIGESSQVFKMQTMNQHLFELFKAGVLSQEDTLNASYNPNDLRILLQTQMSYAKKEEENTPKKQAATTPHWMRNR